MIVMPDFKKSLQESKQRLEDEKLAAALKMKSDHEAIVAKAREHASVVFDIFDPMFLEAKSQLASENIKLVGEANAYTVESAVKRRIWIASSKGEDYVNASYHIDVDENGTFIVLKRFRQGVVSPWSEEIIIKKPKADVKAEDIEGIFKTLIDDFVRSSSRA